MIPETAQKIDIRACISELLYEHNSVGLPGVGSITCNYKPASIDHVQGKIMPPGKELVFDPNLVLDDGLLAEAAARRYGTTLHEAAAAVSEFAGNLQAALDRREMFAIPGVGRLYKDFEHKLQLLPDEVNYNPDSYGLPDLQYYPIVRRQTTEAPPPPASPKAGVSSAIAHWFQRSLLWIALATVLVISATLYWFKFYPATKPQQGETIEAPPEFLNVKPGHNAENEQTPPPGDEDLDDDSEGPTVPPGQKTCMIRVGRFGSADNVKRLVSKAQELGMNPYTKAAGNLTEVGITFEYSDEKDIREMLSAVRRSLSKDAVVESK